MKQKEIIKKYMAQIGKKGGQKSKRTLTPEQAKKMVEAREAKKIKSNYGK